MISLLTGYGQSIVKDIQDHLASTGTNATGKTSKSLRYELKQEGNRIILNILGRAYITAVETGRKATPDKKPSKEFVASIKEWMAAKNVQGSPYAIARSINIHGTKLKQLGGRNDIISNVIDQKLTDDIAKSILEMYKNEYVTNIKHIYGNSVK